MLHNPICKTEKETQMYRTDFGTLWEKARVGCFKRTALKHVYYLGWNRSPAQAGCMRQVFGAGALGRPRGIGWRGRWEWGSGWGIHVNPWPIHVSVWQKPLQYCKVISLQLIKINGKKKRVKRYKADDKLCVWSFTMREVCTCKHVVSLFLDQLCTMLERHNPRQRIKQRGRRLVILMVRE